MLRSYLPPLCLVVACGSPQAVPSEPPSPLPPAFRAGLCAPTERHPGTPGPGATCPSHGLASTLTFKEVGYAHRPQGSGFAGRTLRENGLVRGAHFSGGPGQPPMVSEEWGCVSRPCLEAVELVALHLRAERGATGALLTTPGSTEFSVTFRDGRATGVVLRRNEPTSPALERLRELLSEMEVGHF